MRAVRIALLTSLLIAMPVSAATIFSDDFSGSHPGAWSIGHDGGGGSYAWAWPNDYAHAYSGVSSGQYFYPNNLRVYMERRNVSLSGYSSASLTFYRIVDTEACCDHFTVNVRDQWGAWHEMFRASGTTDPLNWTLTTVDLSQFAGQTGLYIQFRFDSDSSVSGSPYDGVYIDSVTLTANAAAPTYAVYGVINSFNGTVDADGDGYFEKYTFNVGIDGDVSPGSATVYGRMICPTTGDTWWSLNSWTITGTATDYKYFDFSEVDFPAITGNTNLDFTVEIWNSTKTTKLATDTTVTGEPVKADKYTVSVPVLNTVRMTPIPPVDRQQFTFTLTGSGFDPATAEAFFLGPGCSAATSCVVSNGTLTTKTNSTLSGPATLGDGSFTIQVRNTSNNSVSGARGLYVATQSGTTAPRALVLLVDFSDEGGQTQRDYFHAMMFGTNPTEAPRGSFRDYFEEISYGDFNADGAVNNATIAWIRLPQTSTYYAGACHGLPADPRGSTPPCTATYPQNAQKMVEDALTAARNLGLDFGPFDADNDQFVDALFVIHAGRGGEDSLNRSDIWSHAWTTTTAVNTGSTNSASETVYVSRYTTEPEFLTTAGDMTMGVFAHEYGHTRWGLPDLYDTDGSSQGVGNWSLMAGGSWNGTPSGSSPAHMDAWSKAFVAFLTPTLVTSILTNEPIGQAATTADVYQLLTGSAITHTGEYFLVENRQRTGFDSGLPSSGLLIWHIDESQGTNANENYPGCSGCTGHYKVQLVQADNDWDMEKNDNRGDSGDPYPGVCGSGTCNQSFTGTSSPNSRLWNGQASGLTITSISASSSQMTATLSPTAATAPSLSISKTHSGNFTQGQQNVSYTLTVSNGSGAGATSGTVTVTDTLPSGLSLASMYGSGWSCTGTSCSRSDALNGGTSYPSITLSVNVQSNATSPQVNQAAVSGGGSSAASDSDSTTICYTLTGTTAPSGVGSITVNTGTNCGTGYSSGTEISLTAIVPSGYTFSNWSGSGGSFSNSSTLTTSFTITGKATVTATFTPAGISAPTALSASAVSATVVALSWNGVAGATSYKVFRGTSVAAYSMIGSSGTPWYSDPTAVAGTSYLYKVRASNGTYDSGDSNVDLATTIVFTDPALVARSTRVKAVHLAELRTAVNTVRAAAGLSPTTFSPSMAFGMFIQAAHIAELRSSLDAARAQLGLNAMIYVDPTITGGSTLIKAAHINDLRSGVN